MRKISFLIISLAFALTMAVAAFGQAAAQPGAGRIGWLNTSDFADEKAGITKYINAIKAVETEMKPRVTELQGMQNKLKTISDDLVNMRKAGAIVDEKAAAAKQDEGQALQRQFEFKKKDYEVAYDKRSAEVLGPISADIMKAVQDYCKQKGYSAVLDTAMLAQSRAILALDPTADITKDFIAYYNSRSAATATTAVPK